MSGQVQSGIARDDDRVDWNVPVVLRKDVNECRIAIIQGTISTAEGELATWYDIIGKGTAPASGSLI